VTAKKQTLGKNERLKSRKSIERLFSEGKRFAIHPYKVFYILSGNTEPAVKFGVGVSARNFKKSVDRNRVKRIGREAYRLHKNTLVETIIHSRIQADLFFVYTAKELPDFQQVTEKMKLILAKLTELVNEKAASNT
jgi:ribonuclease P protein component